MHLPNKQLNCRILQAASLLLLAPVILQWVAAPCVAQERQSASGWSQFGHAQDWQTGFEWTTETQIAKSWQVTVGQGRSQIVGHDGSVYVTSATVVSAGKGAGTKEIQNAIRSLDSDTGTTRWEYKFTAKISDKQETFGGAKPSPQSTPLIIGNRLLAISFTGQVVCLKRDNGKLLWKKSLVDQLGGAPVQFGFSSSPVCDPENSEHVVFLSAGESGGLYSVDIKDGSTVWKAECQTCSYATPLRFDHESGPQWVVVSSDEVLGIDRRTGKQKWRFPLSEPGLTNVPTPLLVGKNNLLLSGQGIKGTRAITIGSKGNGDCFVEEVWHQRRLQYFYTNWAALDVGRVIGCTDKYLAVADAKDGTMLGRWRGFREGNLVRAGQSWLLLNGKGKLSVLRLNARNNAILHSASYELVEGRCWTPPSVIGSQMFVRHGDKLTCFQMGAPSEFAESASPLVNQLDDSEELEIKQSVDPVEKIIEAFSENGKAAALEVYQAFRSRKQLTPAHYASLIEASHEQRDTQLVTMLLRDAEQQFPESPVVQELIQSFGK